MEENEMNLNELGFPRGKVLTDEECDRIVQLADAGSWQVGNTINPSEDKRIVLRSGENWELPWIHTKIGHAISEVVNLPNVVNFNITSVEPLEILKYGVGGKYDYHYDGLINQVATPRDTDVRKISASVALNDDFEGGSLEFLVATDDGEEGPYGNGLKDLPIHLKKGEMIIFPSAALHRVTPVKKGHRYTMVVWCRGPLCR